VQKLGTKGKGETVQDAQPRICGELLRGKVAWGGGVLGGGRKGLTMQGNPPPAKGGGILWGKKTYLEIDSGKKKEKKT